jgi:hypothetical protein
MERFEQRTLAQKVEGRKPGVNPPDVRRSLPSVEMTSIVGVLSLQSR